MVDQWQARERGAMQRTKTNALNYILFFLSWIFFGNPQHCALSGTKNVNIIMGSEGLEGDAKVHRGPSEHSLKYATKLTGILISSLNFTVQLAHFHHLILQQLAVFSKTSLPASC